MVAEFANPMPGKLWEIGKSESGVVWIRYFLTTPEADMRASLAALLEVMPEANARIVMDLRGLTAHNPDSRGPAQEWLKAYKKRITSLTVVVPRAVPIVKLITAAVGFAVGIRIRMEDHCDLPEPKSFPRVG